MLLTQQFKLLRVALLSKGLIEQSFDMPKIKQLIISVKAENSYDLINNISLLVSMTGNIPYSILVNRKQGVILPQIILSKPLLNVYLNQVVT